MQATCMERDVTYFRYCDDMIVLASERAACEAAFEVYQEVVERLKLPIHEAKSLQPYRGERKSTFWGAKSKPVFHWANPVKDDAFPWIQFLGYQIRYDVSVRRTPERYLTRATAQQAGVSRATWLTGRSPKPGSTSSK